LFSQDTRTNSNAKLDFFADCNLFQLSTHLDMMVYLTDMELHHIGIISKDRLSHPWQWRGLRIVNHSLSIEKDEYHPLMAGAEPFLFIGKTHPEVGCLLVHGFTGTPLEMRGLGEHLASEGYTALGVRLAGHATRLEDMVLTLWTDWYASLRDGYEMLRTSCKQVFVIGLSLGGIFALTLASRYPVAGVAAFATPYHLPSDPRLRFVKILSLIKPFFPKGASGWYDHDAYTRHVCYPADPTRGYGELVKVISVMRLGLPKVTAPALLVYSRQDPTVREEDGHMQAIFEGLGSLDKTSLWIEGSGHVITCDAKRQEVYTATAAFISAHVNP
jgi:carboxylesterase